MDVQTLTVSFGQDLTSHRSWTAAGDSEKQTQPPSDKPLSWGSDKEREYGDDEYDYDQDDQGGDGDEGGRDKGVEKDQNKGSGQAQKAVDRSASGEDDDDDYGEDDYDGEIDFIDGTPPDQGLALALEHGQGLGPDEQEAAFALSDRKKESDASMLSMMSLKLEMELQQAANRCRPLTHLRTHSLLSCTPTSHTSSLSLTHTPSLTLSCPLPPLTLLSPPLSHPLIPPLTLLTTGCRPTLV